MFPKLRDPVSGLTHLGAAVAAVIGLAGLLYLGRAGGVKECSLLVYGVALILMFCASAAYHSIRSGRQLSRILHRLDHAAIYVLVAGTYTPICLHFFTGFWCWGLLAILWGMACVGIGVKLLVLNVPRWLTPSIALVMGWLGLIAVGEMVRTMPIGALVWVLLGGIFFTVGAVVYIAKRPNFWPRVFGFHELWHIFVILGCGSHFVAIAAYVAPAV
jgi:hemolysin III